MRWRMNPPRDANKQRRGKVLLKINFFLFEIKVRGGNSTPNLAISHDPTSPSIHNFLAGGNADSQLLAGAIHNLEGLIHPLVHNFWQGNGSNGDLSNRDRHSHGASSPHFTSLSLPLHSHLPVTHHISPPPPLSPVTFLLF